jgi:anaphase-promoting complex subunit 1
MSISLDAIDPTIRIVRSAKAVLVKDAVGSAATVVLVDGLRYRVSFDLVPSGLTRRALDILSLWMPHDLFFPLHWLFLRIWTERGCARIEDKQFRCLKRALCTYFNIGEVESTEASGNAFQEMLGMERYRGMKDDPAISHLQVPLEPKPKQLNLDRKPHPGIALALVAFNYLAEDLRTQTNSHDSLSLIVPLICRIAMHIRPEWADYWKRLLPSALTHWPAPSSMGMTIFLIHHCTYVERAFCNNSYTFLR